MDKIKFIDKELQKKNRNVAILEKAREVYDQNMNKVKEVSMSNAPSTANAKSDTAKIGSIVKLAFEHIENNRFRDAQIAISEILKQDKDNPKIHNLLGFTILSQGEHTIAKVHFQRALDLNKQYVDAANNIAICLKREKKYADALDKFLYALKLSPDNDVIEANIGELKLKIKKFKDAKIFLESSISKNPCEPKALNNLGLANMSLGNFEQAYNNFKLALNTNPAYQRPAINYKQYQVQGAWKHNRTEALISMDLERELIAGNPKYRVLVAIQNFIENRNKKCYADSKTKTMRNARV